MTHEEGVKRYIYSITCVANGKTYVGSTHDLTRRWRAHRYDLTCGTHKNIILQRAWSVYGKDAQLITNLAKFSRENGLSASPMARVANGKCTAHKGWKCQHASIEAAA